MKYFVIMTISGAAGGELSGIRSFTQKLYRSATITKYFSLSAYFRISARANLLNAINCQCRPHYHTDIKHQTILDFYTPHLNMYSGKRTNANTEISQDPWQGLQAGDTRSLARCWKIIRSDTSSGTSRPRKWLGSVCACT